MGNLTYSGGLQLSNALCKKEKQTGKLKVHAVEGKEEIGCRKKKRRVWKERAIQDVDVRNSVKEKKKEDLGREVVHDDEVRN